MPKKKFESRLQALFSAFESQEAVPEMEAVQARQELEGARSLLPDLETLLPEIPPPTPAPQVEPPPPAASSPALPASILYEPDQLGYAFSANQLQELQGALPGDLDPNRALMMPLVETGQPVGAVLIEPDPTRPLSPEEQHMAEAVARQVSLQIQSLRLLSSAERARAEAQAATRRFTHESWESYLDAIHQFERIGYEYDQGRVAPFLEPPPAEADYRETVNILDEQIGQIILKTRQGAVLSEYDRGLISAVAQQVGQQVENLRLLADAARARADAEEATRRLTRESWKDYAMRKDDANLGFIYDSNHVSTFAVIPDDITVSEPLIVRGEQIGELAVAGMQDLTPENARLVADIAAQTSIHLENLRLNEELRKRAAELQELDRLKSSFLANMSHELRTPLNSILGFSDVMLEGIDGPLTETMNNDLRLIQKNGQHLLHLINDVLDMAKIESGRMNLHLEKFKITQVFNEVISITSTFANDKHLQLFIEPDSDGGIEIVADITRLRQVMINLVNNSIKFTEKGSVSLRADALADSYILISVKDTGIGIPPDHLETIFQEFSQVDTSTTRKAGGTGLGLPISRRLVELHGGRMWAESKNLPGEGSTFFVVMPNTAVISENVEFIARK